MKNKLDVSKIHEQSRVTQRDWLLLKILRCQKKFLEARLKNHSCDTINHLLQNGAFANLKRRYDVFSFPINNLANKKNIFVHEGILLVKER